MSNADNVIRINVFNISLVVSSTVDSFGFPLKLGSMEIVTLCSGVRRRSSGDTIRIRRLSPSIKVEVGRFFGFMEMDSDSEVVIKDD